MALSIQRSQKWSSTSQDTNSKLTKVSDFFLIFSEYVASWVSVEHDVRWAERVRKILAKLPWGDKVMDDDDDDDEFGGGDDVGGGAG